MLDIVLSHFLPIHLRQSLSLNPTDVKSQQVPVILLSLHIPSPSELGLQVFVGMLWLLGSGLTLVLEEQVFLTTEPSPAQHFGITKMKKLRLCRCLNL